MINNYIREGFVEHRSNKSSDANTGKTGFHLERWLKKSFRRFNVSFNDRCCAPVAIDATATATVDAIEGGFITSTSAAATTITLPTATALGTALQAKKGVSATFVVDNSAGANTVTVAVGTGITAKSALTGGTTLTVAAGAAGKFVIYFYSATTAQISRLF